MFRLYDTRSSATPLMREGTDLSAHTAYASKGGRERNRFLAYLRWDELGPQQLGMEDDTGNLIGLQTGLGDIKLMARTRIEGFSVDKQYDHQESFFFNRLITD